MVNTSQVKCPACGVVATKALVNRALSELGDAQTYVPSPIDSEDITTSSEFTCFGCFHLDGITVQATQRCEQCTGKFFCDEDAARHASRMKHSLSPLKLLTDHFGTIGDKAQLLACSTHPGQYMDMFCVDCRTSLCARCAVAHLLDLNDHSIKAITERTHLSLLLAKFAEDAVAFR